jgi:hypothetical protein
VYSTPGPIISVSRIYEATLLFDRFGKIRKILDRSHSGAAGIDPLAADADLAAAS